MNLPSEQLSGWLKTAIGVLIGLIVIWVIGLALGFRVQLKEPATVETPAVTTTSTVAPVTVTPTPVSTTTTTTTSPVTNTTTVK